MDAYCCIFVIPKYVYNGGSRGSRVRKIMLKQYLNGP